MKWFLIAMMGLVLVGCASPQQRVVEFVDRDLPHEPEGQYTVHDLNWLVGVWRGEWGKSNVDEVWVRPVQGNMNGTFRLFDDDGLKMMELLSIDDHEGGVLMQVKHFNPGVGLPGWEEKDASVQFKLVRADSGVAVFLMSNGEHAKWLTYKRTGNTLRVWFQDATANVNDEDVIIFRLAS